MLQYFKAFVHLALLITVPSTALYPQFNTPIITIEAHDTAQEFSQKDDLLSYDDVLNLIDALENGELEKTCTDADLEKINHFLANLAQQGLLPDEIEEGFALENDVQELLYGENNLYEYALSFNYKDDYTIASTAFNKQEEILLCKSWIAKKWNQTKKFVKKHRKAILIGAAVAVAAVVIICAVAAASTAGAVAAAAGAAGAATSESDKEKNEPIEQNPAISSLSTPEVSPILAAINETSMLKKVFEEHICIFKETITENHLIQMSNPSQNHKDPSFEDKLRYLGSGLAHQVLDAVDELTCFLPHLLEEIKDLGQLLPEGVLHSPAEGYETTPKENHEKLIALGHEKIDELFSTDQANCYTPEAKAIRANGPQGEWAIAVLPFPGIIEGTSLNTNQLAEE
ncbi:MAG: hypothetical protein V4494_03085 [Chlamydiota bacterium]